MARRAGAAAVVAHVSGGAGSTTAAESVAPGPPAAVTGWKRAARGPADPREVFEPGAQVRGGRYEHVVRAAGPKRLLRCGNGPVAGALWPEWQLGKARPR